MSVQPGDRRGRLFVLESAPKLPDQKHSGKRWKVRCDCGTVKEVWHSSLRVIKSCGCLRREKARQHMYEIREIDHKGNTRHGLSKTRTWNIWCDMRRRCTQPTAAAYPRYGGRGIQVFDAWRDYTGFVEDMGECPPGLTLERIDNDGNYEPGNCRWATRKEQARNRSSNRLVNAFGRIQTVAAWAEETGIKSNTIRSRIDRGGLTAEEALSK